eukprot:TRINITY_DN28039_c0_g1_i1.p1 TRINITY_DN28039_c0_g1~~TRINITY_DN28039_c0_g1_i1.p1  ORF type:complete len:354 (+),score=53.54 TRINITY_DN28039_c0_g1_i1:36-1064(+)
MATAMLRRRVSAFSAASRILSLRGRHASSLASLVHGHAATAPSSFALVAPQQGVAWSYEQLSQRSSVAAGVLSKLGYSRGDVIVTDLPNSVENLVLQVACSHLGVAVATAKDANALKDLSNAARVRGAVTYVPEGAAGAGWLLDAGLPIATSLLPQLNASLGPLGDGDVSAAPAPVDADGSAALGYWSSTKPLTNKEAIDTMGADAKAKLAITSQDRVLVSITLCHAFGIGSAVGCAFLSGAAVVLPGASGIRGCGSPSQRAHVTLNTLVSERCSVLFSDIHTLKALPPAGDADLTALRTGVCKVGSGATFLDDVKEAAIGPNGEMRPLEYAGVTFVAIGKK